MMHGAVGAVGDHLLSVQPDLAELGEGEDRLECLGDERLAPHLALGIGHWWALGHWGIGHWWALGHWGIGALGIGHLALCAPEPLE